MKLHEIDIKYDKALRMADSTMTHRQRYAVSTNRSTIIDLLALLGVLTAV